MTIEARNRVLVALLAIVEDTSQNADVRVRAADAITRLVGLG